MFYSGSITAASHLKRAGYTAGCKHLCEVKNVLGCLDWRETELSVWTGRDTYFAEDWGRERDGCVRVGCVFAAQSFLSGQAAAYIPEFPSFLCTHTYTRSVQLFPVEGKEVGREVEVLFSSFYSSACHTNPSFLMGLCSAWRLWSFPLCQSIGEAVSPSFFLRHRHRFSPCSAALVKTDTESVCLMDSRRQSLASCRTLSLVCLLILFSHIAFFFFFYSFSTPYKTLQHVCGDCFVISQRKKVCDCGTEGSHIRLEKALHPKRKQRRRAHTHTHTRKHNCRVLTVFVL